MSSNEIGGGHMSKQWTDQEIAELIRLAATGISYSAIGEQMGFSKNAIIGKAHRLGLGKRLIRNRAAKPKQTEQEAPVVDVPKKEKGRVKFDSFFQLFTGRRDGDMIFRSRHQESQSHKAVKLLELEPHHCRFPRGEGSAITFCGNARLIRSSYCADCARIVYERAA